MKCQSIDPIWRVYTESSRKNRTRSQWYADPPQSWEKSGDGTESVSEEWYNDKLETLTLSHKLPPSDIAKVKSAEPMDINNEVNVWVLHHDQEDGGKHIPKTPQYTGPLEQLQPHKHLDWGDETVPTDGIKSDWKNMMSYLLSWHHPAISDTDKQQELIDTRTHRALQLLNVHGMVKFSDEMVDHVITTPNLGHLVDSLLTAEQLWFKLEHDEDFFEYDEAVKLQGEFMNLTRNWTVDEKESPFYVGVEDLRSDSADQLSDWDF